MSDHPTSTRVLAAFSAVGTYEDLAVIFSRVDAETDDSARGAGRAPCEAGPPATATGSAPPRAAAAALFHITAARLLSPGRHRDICATPWIAAWILRQRGWSTLKIGRSLSLDHSSVLRGLRRAPPSQELLLLASDAAERIETLSMPADSGAIE